MKEITQAGQSFLTLVIRRIVIKNVLTKGGERSEDFFLINKCLL